MYAGVRFNDNCCSLLLEWFPWDQRGGLWLDGRCFEFFFLFRMLLLFLSLLGDLLVENGYVRLCLRSQRGFGTCT